MTLDHDAVRALADAATEGPWLVNEHGQIVDDVDYVIANAYLPDDADGAFIAAARTAVPTLLDENAALRAEVGRLTEERNKALALVDELASNEDCWLDHHGGCQAHGYLSLMPGEKCPHQEAKEILAENGATT